MSRSKITVSNNAQELAEDLGFSPSKAVEWQVRHQITMQIIKLVAKEEYTITEIAKKAGTSRARITKIIKGQSEGISIDTLLRVLGALGSSVKLSFRKAA